MTFHRSLFALLVLLVMLLCAALAKCGEPKKECNCGTGCTCTPDNNCGCLTSAPASRSELELLREEVQQLRRDVHELMKEVRSQYDVYVSQKSDGGPVLGKNYDSKEDVYQRDGEWFHRACDGGNDWRWYPAEGVWHRPRRVQFVQPVYYAPVLSGACRS